MKGHFEGVPTNPILRGLTIAMVINQIYPHYSSLGWSSISIPSLKLTAFFIPLKNKNPSWKMQLPFLLGSSWWLNQPIWKNMLVKMGEHLPHFVGENSKNIGETTIQGLFRPTFSGGKLGRSLGSLRRSLQTSTISRFPHSHGEFFVLKKNIRSRKTKKSATKTMTQLKNPMKTCQFLVAKFMKRTLNFWTHSSWLRLKETFFSRGGEVKTVVSLKGHDAMLQNDLRYPPLN